MSQRVLLLGLEDGIASRLTAVLPADRYEAVAIPGAAAPQFLGQIDAIRPSVICMPADPAAAPLMEAIRHRLALVRIVPIRHDATPEQWRLDVEGPSADSFAPPPSTSRTDWISSNPA